MKSLLCVACACLSLASISLAAEVPTETVTRDSLRAAVEDLGRTFGERYPGDDFLKSLDTVAEGDEKSLRQLAREALIANPLVSDRPILFVTRHQYRSHYHAIDTLFHTKEFNPDRGIEHADLFQGGGSIKTLDVKTGKVTTLLKVPNGIARDPDIHFDGKRFVFALRRDKHEDYRICEMATDGGELRQLTKAEGVCDFDPIYLPDDSIVFSSTREPKYNMCSRDIAANLFRMEADGANIHQITRNTLFDNHAELMPDGRILYARWEYVDRNFGDAHGLWTVNPTARIRPFTGGTIRPCRARPSMPIFSPARSKCCASSARTTTGCGAPWRLSTADAASTADRA